MTNEFIPDRTNTPHGDEEEKSRAYWVRFWENAVVRVDGNEVKRSDPVALFHTEEIVLTVEVGPEFARVLRIGLGNPGNLTFTSCPDFNSNVEPIGRIFTWKIKPVERISDFFVLVVYSADVELPLELRWRVLSRYLANEAELNIDGKPPVRGNTFFKNAPRFLTLTPKAGSPIEGFPLRIKAVVDAPLIVTDAKIEPDTTQEIHEWSVTNVALNRSGKGRLSVEGAGMNSISVEESKFLSNDLREEANLLVDGNVMPPSGLDFQGGRTYIITLDYKNFEMLRGIPLGLDVNSAELDPDSFDIDPPRLVASKEQQWTFTPPAQWNGSFKIKLFNEENTAELLTPTNRLTEPKHKMRFFHILGGGPVYLPSPPAEYTLIPGVFIAMVDILDAGGVPVANTSVKFICPPFPGATDETNEKGIALTSLIFGAARYKITAIAKVDSEEYKTVLLINASV